MAIPFSLPSDDTTIEQYRSIHQLLMDLTALLHALMTRNADWLRPNNHNNNNASMPNENVPASPAASPAFNASATSQFVFPLSPPNSQPGSPSPFFTSGVTSSAFVLPDVVTSVARAASGGGVTVAAESNIAAAVDRIACTNAAAAIRQKQLRKRKRGGVRVTKRKLAANGSSFATLTADLSREAAAVGAGDLTCCERHEKMAKMAAAAAAAASSTCCCTCVFKKTDEGTDMEVDMGEEYGHAAEQQQQTKQSPSSPQSIASGCYYNVPVEHRTDCCFTQQKRRQGSSTATVGGEVAAATDMYNIPICVHVGEELRKMVECFRNPKELEENMTEDIESVKGNGFMSQFGRTVFTAALLIIGYKLLVRQN